MFKYWSNVSVILAKLLKLSHYKCKHVFISSSLFQVSVTFNVETEVMDPAFNLTTSIIQETLRSIVVQLCAR